MKPDGAVRVGPTILVVALLISLRVLGISALMPVLSPYGLTLTDSALLVGFAFGAYGLTMALMQLPMGALSDRIGRRRTLGLGLVVYVAGNFMAFWAPTIEWLIAARLIEGLGAVSSVALALLADVVPEDRRTVSIAVAGIGAGVSFLLGVSLGPLVALAIGVPGIFLASGIAGVLVLAAVFVVLPADARLQHASGSNAGQPAPSGATPSRPGFVATLLDRRALAADLAGFSMNATLTATMFALPLILVEGALGTPSLDEAGYRTLLLVSVLVGGVLSIGAARAADKRGAVRETAMLSSILIGIGAAALLWGGPLWVLYVVAMLYFAGHGAQSAALPSLLGALVGRERRGAAMGGYNTWSYLGSFVGGVLGGVLYLRTPWLPVVVVALAAVAALALAATREAPAEGPAPSAT